MTPLFDRSTLDKVWILAGIAVLIRLAFLGILNLLPEEAYYWNYAQHLDIGYLDHPPMVAWLIHASQFLLGRSEFAVRLPAFLGWFVMAGFMYRFVEDTVGRGVARTVVLLLAVLPIYMSVGFLMTPDAPFYVCWAGVLYFLSKAILKNRPLAWYGAGLFLGLGMLSKYTMGLVVPAALAYVLIDRNSRHWLKSPHPYVAALLALIIFSPVLYWNATHEWASFAFQGTRRWSGGMDFQLHILLGSILVLLTPLGLYEAVRVMIDFRRGRAQLQQSDLERYRTYLFLLTFTIVPLAVFVIHSIQGQPKLNWTGPVWMAILPLIAARVMKADLARIDSRIGTLTRRWVGTSAALVVFFAAGFGYMAGGMPGFVGRENMKFPIAWKAYGDRIEEVETKFESDTSDEPLIIGLDKYWLASEASFYDPVEEEEEALPEFAGESLFGGNSLMWNSWVPPTVAAGRNSILVSFDRGRLTQDRILRHFSRLGAIKKEILTGRDGEIGHFYWRAAFDYHPE
jgi:dolichol-phosphate mannosyltransferase